MDYIPPIGGSANDPYVTGDPATGTLGSPVPAEAVEHAQREIVAAISAAGLTPDSEDLAQLATAFDLIARNQTVANFAISENAVLSVPNGAVHTLMNNLGTVDRNELADSTLSASGLTIGVQDAGLWLFDGRGNVQSGENEECFLYRNGAPFAQFSMGATTVAAVVSVAGIAHCGAGDTIQLFYAHTDPAGAQNTTGNNSLRGFRIGG